MTLLSVGISMMAFTISGLCSPKGTKCHGFLVKCYLGYFCIQQQSKINTNLHGLFYLFQNIFILLEQIWCKVLRKLKRFNCWICWRYWKDKGYWWVCWIIKCIYLRWSEGTEQAWIDLILKTIKTQACINNNKYALIMIRFLIIYL